MSAVVTLTTAEAALLVQLNDLHLTQLGQMVTRYSIYQLAVSTRQEAIKKYGEILDEYNGKFQELLW